jgi:hypothetical protein
MALGLPCWGRHILVAVSRTHFSAQPNTDDLVGTLTQASRIKTNLRVRALYEKNNTLMYRFIIAGDSHFAMRLRSEYSQHYQENFGKR